MSLRSISRRALSVPLAQAHARAGLGEGINSAPVSPRRSLEGTRADLKLPHSLFPSQQTTFTLSTNGASIDLPGHIFDVGPRDLAEARVPPTLYHPGLQVIIFSKTDFQRFSAVLGLLAEDGALYAPFQIWPEGKTMFSRVVCGRRHHLPDHMRVIVASETSERRVFAHEILHDVYFAHLDAETRSRFETLVWESFQAARKRHDTQGWDPIYAFYFAIQRTRFEDFGELETHMAVEGKEAPKFKSFAWELFAFAGTTVLGYDQPEEGEIDPVLLSFYRSVGIWKPGRFALGLERRLLPHDTPILAERIRTSPPTNNIQTTIDVH